MADPTRIVSGVRAHRVPGRDVGLAIVCGLLAVGISAVLINPAGPATSDPDSAASVLFFQRIASGTRLEVFVATTPKPLLSLVYGATWALLGDWRFLIGETLAVFGVAVAAGVVMVRRIAGLGEA